MKRYKTKLTNINNVFQMHLLFPVQRIRNLIIGLNPGELWHAEGNSIFSSVGSVNPVQLAGLLLVERESLERYLLRRRCFARLMTDFMWRAY
jgi:hypothetical protein